MRSWIRKEPRHPRFLMPGETGSGRHLSYIPSSLLTHYCCTNVRESSRSPINGFVAWVIWVHDCRRPDPPERTRSMVSSRCPSDPSSSLSPESNKYSDEAPLNILGESWILIRRQKRKSPKPRGDIFRPKTGHRDPSSHRIHCEPVGCRWRESIRHRRSAPRA